MTQRKRTKMILKFMAKCFMDIKLFTSLKIMKVKSALCCYRTVSNIDFVL